MDKQLHVTDYNMFTIFRVNPNDDSEITSIVANETSIAFATSSGKVYSMDANHPIKRWEFDTVGAINAPLTKLDDVIYVSSKDTNLYKLDAHNGKQIWKFYTGCFLGVSARAYDKVVYQNAPNKGLYAIDANSGKQIWLSKDGADVLAQDANTAYVISKKNICEVMDNLKAKKLYTINFEAVTAFATNPFDSKMYVMEDNKILCIAQIKK
jgi:outer membrane protein assembly factor BamB